MPEMVRERADWALSAWVGDLHGLVESQSRLVGLLLMPRNSQRASPVAYIHQRREAMHRSVSSRTLTRSAFAFSLALVSSSILMDDEINEILMHQLMMQAGRRRRPRLRAGRRRRPSLRIY